MSTRLFRFAVIALTALAVLAPLSLVFYQSFLDQPFFQPGAKLGLDAYAFVLGEEDFWTAFFTTVAIAAGMTVIAVPHPKYPPAPDALSSARLVLSSLTELTPGAVSALHRA